MIYSLVAYFGTLKHKSLEKFLSSQKSFILFSISAQCVKNAIK